jgi:predicted MPP superfamily phosphohydrolase
MGFPLFAGACLGHLAILVASHNFWYGLKLGRTAVEIMHLLHGLAALVGVFVLWGLTGGDVLSVFHLSEPGWWRVALATYLVLCWLAAFVAFPVLTIRRHLRGRPTVLVSNHTHTVNVTERLGYKPIGLGFYRHLARLPGNQVFHVDFAERHLRLPLLPSAWDGLTILHLSDLHFNGTPDRVFFDQVMDLCAGLEPDIVALTGDVVDSREHHRWIVPVLRRLRWHIAAFAVLGNHDRWYDSQLVRRRLRRCDIVPLGNAWRRIEVRGEPLVVIGHEGPWFGPPPDLSDCPPDAFRLCLSHTPDNMPWARRNAVDLMLAGHVHGGQVRLPLIGSVLVPSRFGRRYDCGTFDEPPTVLHVSRGLSGKEPIRYNCRPEVCTLVLRSADAHCQPACAVEERKESSACSPRSNS